MSEVSTIDAVAPSPPPALVKTPMSREQFDALGETHHHELYEGICVVNRPRRRHVIAERSLCRLLEPCCPEGFEVLPEWAWDTGDSVFEPDLMVVRVDGPSDVQREAPLLVVEILSPSNRLDDLVTKRRLYAVAGAPWYWIVDLDEPSVLVLRNVDGQFIEEQRLSAPGVSAGPLAVSIDPAALAPAG